MRAVLVLSLAFCVFATLALSSGGSAGERQGPERWNAFVRDFVEAYFAAHPDAAVRAGRHELDGRLPDWSREGLERETARLRAARERALSFAPDDLGDVRRFEREYLIAVIDGELFWLTSARWPFRNPHFYENGLDPQLYVTREYASPAVRLKSFIAYARAVPAAVRQIRANLQPPLPRTYVDVGITMFGGLAAFYESDVPAAFAAVDDPLLQEELKAATAAAILAVRELAAWLEGLRPAATEDFALGPERFREMLWTTERVDAPLESIESAGRRDLERNLAALREACAELAPGASVQECVARVDARKPEGGPLEEARRQLPVLKALLLEGDLVSIPGTEEARVAEAPPFRRYNLAYIDIPGPYDRGVPSTYFIAPPDPSWTPEERAAYTPGRADLLFVSVHEVWPGHFLQYLHAHRSPSPIGRVFVGYGFSEGWAHYAEELMLEARLGEKDPEIRIGQLLNALLRDARLLSAIGLHTGSMSVADAERLFRESACQDPATARQQAARGTFDPAFLNYTLGKLMIRKLREDWTASRGGRAAWRAFHDRLLSFGGPPIPLLRAELLGPGAGPPL